ncbi:Zeta toxin [Seminavis robusta]|uniref:Zeta toxin n=1 Tax=Seminavis robusta TaxID=568900 RepID=A0A9N8EYL1_9STRA|nr:Zeta toxin [Seminavis robusta]|eukprot:Sro2426_g327300.1 Zeta toxin (657) ;mRNA; r:6400-8920
MTSGESVVANEAPHVQFVEKSSGRFDRLRRASTKRFSIKLSTDEYNQSDEKKFYGPYQHIKKELDYTYHSYYRIERQWLHDSIIEDYLCHEEQAKNCVPAEPWLLYTCGVKGSGKRYLIDRLMEDGRLPLLSTIIVDADEIRRSLPEFSSYADSSPELLPQRMNKEAGYIAEILTLAALQAGNNVIIDGQLADVVWRIKQFSKLKKQHPKLRVALIHVTAPLDVILERVERRALETGFHIPKEDTARTLQEIPDDVETLANEVGVSYCCTVHNNNDNGGDFVLEGDHHQTWEQFTKNFQQEVEVIKPGSSSGAAIEELAAVTTSDPKRIARPQALVFSRRQASTQEKQYAATSFRLRRKSTRKPFRVDVSTEDYHASNDRNFYGKYSHIRETLDYSYHKNYSYERQKFQDAIITEFLHGAVITDKDGQLCTTPTEPWLVFTGGAMGAGKSYTMRRLVENGQFPLIAFITVDPDMIRRQLPEYHVYCESNPELAGTLTHKESGYIAEILTLAGLQSGKNVMVDGSLRNAEWYKTYFKRLRSDFPILRLAIIHVTAPREAIFQRAAERALVTGRVVPTAVLEEAIEQVPRSMKILAPLVNYHVDLNNAPGAPDIELGTEGETWSNFSSKWVQACAWVPGSKKKEKLIRLNETGPACLA